MVTVRHLSFLLVAVAACTQRPAATNPQPLIPRNGPEASVRVEYEGGVFSRRLSALFRVERPAYVMVAHLGGDGVIRVLFPEDARESGWVRPRRLFRTDITPAAYDAAPGFWFLQPHVMRNVGARIDSYDGNGHGYVFLIASNAPLRFDRVSQFGIWDELEMTNYPSVNDPREAVRRFANLMSPSGRYTLDYASSMSSYSHYSFADAQMDCSILSSGFGFGSWLNAFGGMHYGGFYERGFDRGFDRGFPGCGASAYQYANANWMGYQTMPRPVASAPVPPIGPERPLTIPRSGRPNPLIPDRGGLTRPTFAERASDATRRRGVTAERRAGGSERFGSTRDRRSPVGGEPVYPAPSTPHRGAFGFRSPGTGAPTGSLRPWHERTRSEPSGSPGRTSTPATTSAPATSEGSVSAPRAAPGSDRRKP